MKLYKKLAYVALGVGLTLLMQLGYKAITGPDLVYRHRHFGNPSQHGPFTVSTNGRYFSGYSFAGGAEGPKDVGEMVNEALADFRQWNILEQAGIGNNQPVREVRIEIKK